MQIFVKTLTGASTTIESSTIVTIDVLKRKNQAKKDIMSEQQRVIFAGEQPKD